VGQLSWLVLALAFAVFAVRCAGLREDPRPVLPGGSIPSPTIRGFGEVGFRVTGPAGATTTPGRIHCALLARTVAQQRQGLMNRQDLGGYDGMVFQFDGAVETGFYMKDTLIPLSIAWFDASGRFLTSTTMVPCPSATVTCPSYFANAPYHFAIEVRAGGLEGLGIGPGSTLTVGGPC
jgi:uncharacterized membrane protein (UPF0127 family)